jgi:hypothetical protein
VSPFILRLAWIRGNSRLNSNYYDEPNHFLVSCWLSKSQGRGVYAASLLEGQTQSALSTTSHTLPTRKRRERRAPALLHRRAPKAHIIPAQPNGLGTLTANAKALKARFICLTIGINDLGNLIRTVGAYGLFWPQPWGVARASPQAGMGRALGPRRSAFTVENQLSGFQRQNVRLQLSVRDNPFAPR